MADSLPFGSHDPGTVTPSASVSPTVAAEHSAVLQPPLPISCVQTLPSHPINSTMTRHFIPFPDRPFRPGPYHPPGLRRSHLSNGGTLEHAPGNGGS